MSSKAYFERVADQWDAMRRQFFSDELRKQAVEAAGAVAGSVAADVGAGTGFVIEELLMRGAAVVAVDQSRSMLDEIDKKWGSTGRVRTVIGTEDDLRPADECSSDGICQYVSPPRGRPRPRHPRDGEDRTAGRTGCHHGPR